MRTLLGFTRTRSTPLSRPLSHNGRGEFVAPRPWRERGWGEGARDARAYGSLVEGLGGGRRAQRLSKSYLFLAAALMLLAACSTAPPVPDWQMNTHSSAYKAVQAYLVGDSRIALLEWQRARREVSSTGDPLLLARLELLRCAALVASLETSPCTAFETLRIDAQAAELAYADYLAGHASIEQAALLPPAQRAAHDNAAAIADISDPLARLVAAAVAWRSNRATPELLMLATETASGQGWRRPLLAWLLLRAEHAAQAGDSALEAALRRRIALVANAGHTSP